MFTGSSNSLDEVYYEAARNLGVLMGVRGFNLVYGGGCLGLCIKTPKLSKKTVEKFLGFYLKSSML